MKYCIKSLIYISIIFKDIFTFWADSVYSWVVNCMTFIMVSLLRIKFSWWSISRNCEHKPQKFQLIFHSLRLVFKCCIMHVSHKKVLVKHKIYSNTFKSKVNIYFWNLCTIFSILWMLVIRVYINKTILHV